MRFSRLLRPIGQFTLALNADFARLPGAEESQAVHGARSTGFVTSIYMVDLVSLVLPYREKRRLA